MSVRQLCPVLTLRAMDAPSCEPALSFPLPQNPSTELLDRARQEVLTYLDWVAGDADHIRKEITRAAARLIEISLHWKPACDAAIDAQFAAERAEYHRQCREQARELGLPDD